MKKIPTLFVRDRSTGFVTPEILPGNEWILSEPSIPYRKWEGTCAKYDDNGWWSRREVKKDQAIPDNFYLADTDDNTGHLFGWIPAETSSFAKYFDEAVTLGPYSNDLYGWSREFEYGTYELMGPKINKNPENLNVHRLMPHIYSPVLGDLTTIDFTKDLYDVLKNILLALPVEGVVWYHLDSSQKTKLKGKDFAHESQGTGGWI